MNKRTSYLAWLALGLCAVACSRPEPRVTGTLARTESWSPAFVEHFGSLPVQEEGRVMPVSTLAAFTLYAVHGRRDVQFVADGERGEDRKVKLGPTEWLLDVWCYPEQAAQYPMFRIENVRVLEALGFEHQGQRQGFDYLSYDQLMERADKLEDLAKKLRPKPAVQRDEVESQLVHLYEQLVVYHRLHQLLAPLQYQIELKGDGLRSVFGGASQVGLAQVLQNAGMFRNFVRSSGPNGENIEQPQFGNLADVLTFLNKAGTSFGGAALLPPVAGEAADTWHAIADCIDIGTRGNLPPEHLQMIATLQDGLQAKTVAEHEQHLRKYLDQVEAVASKRSDQGKVALESYYYAANWHFHGMMTFVLGFLLAGVACALPRSRILWWLSMVTSGAALSMLAADIWIRCEITGHPPIGRLYDTFLFIGGVGALTLLIAEWVLPRRICLLLAPALAAVLILLGRMFEVADGADTMKPLQAVLLSNFWLLVHVPTINIGYASAGAAAVVAGTWIVSRVLRLEHPDSPFMKSLVRISYGVTCFSLATAVVGTILGGVWANDSWGRFWGWDPKENGALLICLSQIALLHARMSGMVRDAGFVLWTVGTGMVVVFSWFHTNLLGVGLHAYGFSKDLLTGVWVSYCLLGGLIVVGALDVLLRPKPAPFPAREPDAAPATT